MSVRGTESILDVIIGCDCDPDRPKYGGTRYDTSAPLRWHGITEGLPLLRELSDGIIDDFGTPVRLTWCLRSDLQMEEIYGDCAWPIEEFSALWRDLERAGDELTWHPHLWRWDIRAGCWYQETEDVDWIIECLRAGHLAFERVMNRSPRTCRAGWEFHNNTTMREIRTLGIRGDFSAIPGRYTQGCSDRWGSRFCGQVDWRGTPIHMYAPSACDYRVPDGGEETTGLHEIPMSGLHLPLLRLARIARRVFGRRLGAIRELRGALGRDHGPAGGNKLYVTAPPIFFSRLVAQQLCLARERGHATLVTALHPDEMLATSHSLTSLCHPDHVRVNLESLLCLGERFNVRIRFTTPEALLLTVSKPRANAGG